MATKTCKDCKYWDSEPAYIVGIRRCRNEDKLYYHCVDDSRPKDTRDKLIYWDNKAYDDIDLATGPDFGCIHFEQSVDKKG